MATRINRRRFVLAAAGLPILRLVPDCIPTPTRAAEPSGATLDGRAVIWQELVDALARMERKGIEYEHPRTWDSKRYDELIRWSDSVLLVYGFGDAKWSDQRVDEAIEFFDSSELAILAVGWSDDFRAWTVFIEATISDGWHNQRWPFGMND